MVGGGCLVWERLPGPAISLPHRHAGFPPGRPLSPRRRARLGGPARGALHHPSEPLRSAPSRPMVARPGYLVRRGLLPLRRAGPVGQRAGPGCRPQHAARGWRRADAPGRAIPVARVGLVADDVLGAGRHTATLAWLLPDCPSPRLETGRLLLQWPGLDLSLEVESPSSEAPRCALYRQGERISGEAIRHTAEARGWRSPTYAHRQTSLTFVAEMEGPLPRRILTRIRLGGAPGEALRLEWASPGEGQSSFRSLALGGEELQFLG